MVNLSYEEADLLLEILNFKLINKNYIYENYKLFNKVKDKNRKLSNILVKLNNFLIQLEITPSVYKDREIVYYNKDIKSGKKRLIHNGEFILKNLVREEMVEIILLLGKKKFSISKFVKKFEKENKKHVKNDLKKILEKYGIDYECYMKSQDSSNFLEEKIEDYSVKKHIILKNVLIKKWEKVYEKRGTVIDNKIIAFISEELTLKNINYIYERYLKFLREYDVDLSKNSEYVLFTYLLLNLNNDMENTPKRIKKENLILKKEKNYSLMNEMFTDISKNEDIKIYTNFKMKFYKLLLRTEKNEGIMRKNNERFFEDFREIQFRNNREAIYKIAEEEVTISSELKKRIEKERKNKREKIKILLVLDMEKPKYTEYRKEIKVLFSLFNVINIINMEELKGELKKRRYENLKYKQVLLISNIEIQNMTENESNIPVYFINLKERGKSKANRRREFLSKIFEGQNLIEHYHKIKN